MKNIINKFTFFVALSFVFISCGNLVTSENDDSIPQGKGKICISTNLDSQSRSVLPIAIEEDTTGLKWELVGTKDGEQKIIKFWTDDNSRTAYKSMTSDSEIVIDTGIWDFTLTASQNNATEELNVLQAHCNSVQINAGNNDLNFVMQEATEKAASGSIEFTLKFPKDVIDNVVATLYNHENNEKVESSTNFFIDSTTTDNYSSVKYSYQDSTGATSTLAPGYYRLHIDLRQNTGDATASSYKTINTYTCLIRVAPGLCSKGDYTLNSLAKLYTITYECNQGTFGTEPITTSYNKYTSFELPTPTLYGHTFDGWYTDETYNTRVNNASTFKISSDTTLYAKWTKNYDFQLSKQDGGTVAGEYTLVDGSGCVTITDTNTNVSVWNYYLKSNDINFQHNSNYKITVEMKTEDSDSVVAIQAANADMFFTVGTEWTTCTMETGFIEKQLDSTRNAITFGIGLSQKTYFRNLVIEEIDDDGLPTLVFDITTDGINQYLNSDSKAKKIIDVEKVTLADNKLGYSITINTPLSNNNLEQYVKLHLRDYAKNIGVNNVSFKVENTGSNPFATSFMANTASNNSMAWNNVRTEVQSGNYNTCNIDFPNYEANDELIVDVITGSLPANSGNPAQLQISNFTVSSVDATVTPFSGKIFAIQVGETWYKAVENLPLSQEVEIGNGGSIKFDVGMFNGWDSSNNMPSSFEDVTRFFYTGDEKISDNLSYSSDPNGPTYTITNNSGSEVTVKITLNEEYTVSIKEVETATTASGITYAGYDTSGLPKFYITTAEGLVTFRDMVNGTLLDETVTSYTIPADSSVTGIADYSITTSDAFTNISGVLQDDIDLSNIGWIPIGTEDSPFEGSFDGQNKTISNLTISNATTENQGLFGVFDCSLSDEKRCLSNICVTGSITTSSPYAGGLVGQATNIVFQNCENYIKINSSSETVGGFVGQADTCDFIGCTNYADIISTSSSPYNLCVGGIAGLITDVTAEYCYNAGNISANMSVGGIFGFEQSSSISYPTIEYCVNTGVITGSSYYGGIVGYASKALSLGYCANYGEITYSGNDDNLENGFILGGCSSSNITVATEILSVGKSSSNGAAPANPTYYAVSKNASVTYSYYDSDKLTDIKGLAYNGGGAALSSSELINGTTLDFFWAGEWNYQTGRYPIPDLEDNISAVAWNLLVSTVSEQ